MVELKCGLCGGNLKLIDGFGHATCEYCGSTMTLNNMSDEKIDNNSQIRYENLLINAHKAVDDKNWVNVEKYYSLLQEEFPKEIIMEATLFSNIAKIMLDKNLNDFQKQNELWNSLYVIEKYYDITENKEETLNKISELLFKMAFPKGKVAYNSYDQLTFNQMFYGLMFVFSNKLEQLLKIHNEIWLHKLLSKHKQIAIIVSSERKKTLKPYAIFAFISFLIMAIICTSKYLYFASLSYVDDVPFSIVVGLPWLCVIITGIIWNRMNNTGDVIIRSTREKDESQKKLKKIKIIKIISIIWMLFVMIAEIMIFIEDSTIFLACLIGFVIWGVLPYLIVNWIYKITEKNI